MQNPVFTLKVLSGNVRSLCVSFYRIRKVVGFFPEARSNAKITLIKIKGIVIYHGNNNGGINGYCRQKVR